MAGFDKNASFINQEFYFDINISQSKLNDNHLFQFILYLILITYLYFLPINTVDYNECFHFYLT